VEQATILGTALMGAAAAAALVAGAALDPASLALVDGPAKVQGVAENVIVPFATAVWMRMRDAAPWAFVTTAACAASFYAADLYDLKRAAADRRRGGRRILASLAFVAALVAIRAAPGSTEDRALALGAVAASALAVLLLRGALPAIVGAPRRVLIAGDGPTAMELGEALLREAEVRLELVGFVPLEAPNPRLRVAGAPPRGLPADRVVEGGGGLLAAARRTRAQWLVVAPEEARGVVSSRELILARLAGIDCFTPAMFYERLLRRVPVERMRPSDLAYADGFHVSAGRAAIKRSFDLFCAAIGILLAAPLLVVVMLAIRLDSRGPILYRQERVGARGARFQVIKLRTMRVDAEEAGHPKWASEQDPRVTRVGRFLRRTRIDEIPQLFNVLRGDMSMVGPRPERPFFVQRLKMQVPWYGLREAVRPGLTGWAQLRYPYGASVEDAKRKLEYDLYYVKNGSIFLDLAVVFHTVRHVLTARGAR